MKLKKIIPILILITVLFVSLSAVSAEAVSDETVISESANQIDDAILTDGEPANDYYVSPEGSDDNNGTIDSPYKTIEKAVEKSVEWLNVYINNEDIIDCVNSQIDEFFKGKCGD